MEITITIEIDEGSPYVDIDDSSGLTSEAYERLTMHTEEWGPGSLSWLGEVQEVEMTDQRPIPPPNQAGRRKKK